MSYKEDIEIDKYDLANEWENNSSLCIKYSDLSVQANNIKERSELKVQKLEDDLKNIIAELSLKVKFKYKDYGFEKPPSDTSASSWAITQEEYKNKRNELYIAKEECIKDRDLAFRLRSAAKEFSERRFALQNLQQLYINGYYSDSGRDKKNTINENLNESMQRRNKD